MVTARVYIVQCYCAVCGVYCGYSKNIYSAMVLCFLCLAFCGYSNGRYSAMVLCCVWCLLWLKQQ